MQQSNSTLIEHGCHILVQWLNDITPKEYRTTTMQKHNLSSTVQFSVRVVSLFLLTSKRLLRHVRYVKKCQHLANMLSKISQFGNS